MNKAMGSFSFLHMFKINLHSYLIEGVEQAVRHMNLEFRNFVERSILKTLIRESSEYA